MSGPITVPDGTLVPKDPSEILIYVFDWDAENLPVGVSIASENSTITGMSGDITTSPAAITAHTILSGNRKVQIRVSGGALGSKWRLSNFVVTNESPDQRKERSIFILVEDR